MTLEQIISEIKNKLRTYDQAGLLDDISINNWIKECLKQFGGNMMQEHQTSLIIEKGRVKLPDNFWALKAAVKCEQEGVREVKTEPQAQRRVSYLEWTDIRDYYNYLEGKPCLEDEDSRYITETLYFDVPKKSYKFYYKQPQHLTLKPHIYKVRCDANCPNIQTNGKYSISIDENHNYITTDFNEGFMWLWYRGLPSDENCKLVIPETGNDALKNYIVYFVICRTLEDLWLSEDDLNIQQKLGYFSKLRDEYFYQTKSDSIAKGLAGWQNKLINNNRRERNTYENFYRSLTPRDLSYYNRH